MLTHQLINIRKVLEKYSDTEGVNFAYAVVKNKDLIDNRLKDLQFIKKVSSDIIEYEDKRVAICNQYADKDEEGKPIIEKDIYVIEKDKQEEFRSKMEELYKQYKEPIEDRQKQIDLFNEKMNEEISFEFVKIGRDELPPEIKTAKQLEEISFMLD